MTQAQDVARIRNDELAWLESISESLEKQADELEADREELIDKKNQTDDRIEELRGQRRADTEGG